MSRIIYYYQTFNGLGDILIPNTPVTHIHLSSIHFGRHNKFFGKHSKSKGKRNTNPYIHINNNSPYDPCFDTMWDEIEQASKLGIKIVLMVGGAGGGYSSMFSEFDVCYELLSKLLKDKPFISGIDLDIEEKVTLNNTKMLINKIVGDFSNLIITMAPTQSSLETDTPGLGGFIYSDLLNSDEGKYITYLNGQFYDDYSLEAYNNVVDNGYDPKMIVMGTMNSDVKIDDIVAKHRDNFGGVFFWEYKLVEPGPLIWANKMKYAMTPSVFTRIYEYMFIKK
jgi:hypothetical protein